MVQGEEKTLENTPFIKASFEARFCKFWRRAQKVKSKKVIEPQKKRIEALLGLEAKSKFRLPRGPTYAPEKAVKN